jgi:hypothetical protein
VYIHIDVLRVDTGDTIMDMLARSDRVNEDLEMALEPEIIGRFQQNVIVRQWQSLAADMEFRGFVYGSQLNAITQYNYPSYFPRLVYPIVSYHSYLVIYIIMNGFHYRICLAIGASS